MIKRSILYRFVPFLVTLTFGILVGTCFGGAEIAATKTDSPPPGAGSGSASGRGNREPDGPAEVRIGTNKFRIISKPKASYTDDARVNETQGAVLLNVTLLARGEIGRINVRRGLLHGLTEQAIAHAREIKFQPATVDGLPVSTIVNLEYTFTIN